MEKLELNFKLQRIGFDFQKIKNNAVFAYGANFDPQVDAINHRFKLLNSRMARDWERQKNLMGQRFGYQYNFQKR